MALFVPACERESAPPPEEVDSTQAAALIGDGDASPNTPEGQDAWEDCAGHQGCEQELVKLRDDYDGDGDLDSYLFLVDKQFLEPADNLYDRVCRKPGAQGGWSYCSETCLCPAGAGDCDSDADCGPGLRCAMNVGAQYGLSSSADVCESCQSGANGGWSFCHPGCPCGHMQGDCDSDADCAPGTVCVHNVGAQYGWYSSVDVCLIGTN